jgi:hypothetical protein
MNSDHEAEIRASVGAHRDLGSGYDDALAEGLVERIGAEIDRRIDARLGQFGAHGPVPGPGAQPGAAVPPESAVPPGSAGPEAPTRAYETYQEQGPAGYSPSGYPGYPGYPGPVPVAGYQGHPWQVPPPGYQVPPGYHVPPGPYGPTPGVNPAAPSAARSVAFTVTALGSMAIGVAATAVVSRAANPGAQAVMVLLIWTAIAVINIVYARRR